MPWLLLALLVSASAQAETQLIVAMRDGSIRTVGDATPPAIPPPKTASSQKAMVRAFAVAAGRRYILDGAELRDGARRVPGNFSDVIALAGGPRLRGATASAVFDIDVKTGARVNPAKNPPARIVALAADGDAVYAITVDGAVTHVGAIEVPGRAMAAAAAAGHVFIATREGPLWQLDIASGRKRDLGLGSWWGTIALAADATHVYAVTVSGKIWSIDIVALSKTAVAMEGWEGAAALALE